MTYGLDGGTVETVTEGIVTTGTVGGGGGTTVETVGTNPTTPGPEPTPCVNGLGGATFFRAAASFSACLRILSCSSKMRLIRF